MRDSSRKRECEPSLQPRGGVEHVKNAKRKGLFNVVEDEGRGVEMSYRNHSLKYCYAWTGAIQMSKSFL